MSWVAGDADHGLRWPLDAAVPTLWLMPERAVFEPDSGTLFVADMHLGKAAVFRARGLPVPQGTTTTTLARLSQALERTEARRLVVLGDFLHARESHAAGTLAALSAWRARHPALNCLVVEGNHDVHAGRVQASLGIEVSPEPYACGLLRAVHEPPVGASVPVSGSLTLAGHVHPVATLRGRADSLRLPVFWLKDNVLTLPAFGEFTGGFEVRASAQGDEHLFVVGQKVVPLIDVTRVEEGKGA